MKNNLIGISGKIGSGKDSVGIILQGLSEGASVSNIKYILENSFSNPPPGAYQIKKFADKLKDIACLLIGCTREQLEDRKFKEKELGEEWWYYERLGKLESYLENKHFNYKTIPLIKLTPRKLLQLLGTECGREIIHPNIWVNALFADYKTFNEPSKYPNGGGGKAPRWIITDVRFPNEAQAIKDRGGIVIRVNRLKIGDIVYWDDPEGFSSGVYKIRSINNEEAWIIQTDFMAEAQALPSELSLFIDPEHPSETGLDDYNDFDYVIDNNGSIKELVEKVKQLKLV